MTKLSLLGEILNSTVNFCRDYEKGVIQPFIIGYAGSDCKSYSVDRYSGQYGEGYRVHFPNTTSRNCHTVIYFIAGLPYQVKTVLCPISSHDYWPRVASALIIGDALKVDIKFIEHASECCYRNKGDGGVYLGRSTFMLLQNKSDNPSHMFLGDRRVFSSRYDVIKRAMCVLNKGEKSDEC